MSKAKNVGVALLSLRFILPTVGLYLFEYGSWAWTASMGLLVTVLAIDAGRYAARTLRTR